MMLSRTLFAAAFLLFTPIVYGQISFSDGSVQTTAATDTFVSTIIVSPVGNTTQNGTALKTAYESVAGATVNSPIVVKVEPGVYNLGSGRINLIPYVNIEGSGPESTIIRSTQNSVSVAVLDFEGAGGSVEVRGLTVRHTGSGSAMGVYSDSYLYLSEVNIEFTGTLAGDVFGVYNNGGFLRMRDCDVSTSGYSITNGSSGIIGVSTTSEAELFDTAIRLVGSGASYVTAVYNQSGDTTLRNCVATAVDLTSPGAYGIWANTGLMLAASSEIDGSDAATAESSANTVGIVHCWDSSFFPLTDF